MSRYRRSRLLAVPLLLALLAGCSPAGAPPTEPGPIPSRPTIEAAVDQLVGNGSARYANTQAVVVSRRGQTVAQRYYDSDAEAYADVQSVTKSVTATLVGIALAEGELDGLDQTVGELLPQHRSVMSKSTAAVTLEQLLTMNAGWSALPPGAGLDQPDLVRKLLAAGPDTNGEFAYNNASPHVLAAILVRATGRSLLDYARARLFTPLGITTEPAFEGPLADEDDPSMVDRDFGWLVDDDGVHAGFSSLRLTAADLVTIGELYRAQGRWEGRQLLTADFVAAATTAQEPGPSSGYGYGYLWWVTPVAGHPAYAAFGSWGQMVMVVPDLELVVAVLSRPVGEPGDEQEPLAALVEGSIIPNLP